MKYKRRFGDRYDGRLIRKADLIYKMVPYVMKTRIESQNLFEYEVDITNIEAYLRGKRNQGIKIGLLHIIIAAMVRVISQKPRINRFVAGRRVYARNQIDFAFAVKKGLSEDAAETTLKLKFEPKDTIFDVMEKINRGVEENKKEENENETDRISRFFTLFPGFIIKFLVWIILTLDYYGLMPKVVHRASPFHSSVFFTDLGSLGIQPVYHHLYNIGTCSVFIAFGAKHSRSVIDKDNNVAEKKFVNIRVSTDERIVDGYYYAVAFKLFNRLLQHPERLDVAPEWVVEDLD